MVLNGIETIRVQANGINFEVVASGRGDRLALCLHGFPEHAYSWRYQIPMLAQLGYRVWAPNLRGYGNSDSPKGVRAYRLETLVDDVAGLIEASGTRETLLIGHDWGGVLAWQIAMDRSASIDRLIILNLPHPACFLREVKRPVQFFKSWYVFMFQMPVLPELLLGAFHARGVGAMIRRSSRNASRFPEQTLEVYRQNASRPGGLAAMLNWYRAALRGGGVKTLYRDRYPTIETPTLFLWGDADAALSLRTTEDTREYVPNLTFRVLQGVSHWIQQEAPEAVNAMIGAWLKGKPVPEYEEISR
jgi:epoxide hydrolase 4